MPTDKPAGNASASALKDLIGLARLRVYDGEPLTIEAANMAGRPCDLRCSVCDGEDVLHHWLDECDEAGDPLQVCKHCEAWRDYPDDDLEWSRP